MCPPPRRQHPCSKLSHCSDENVVLWLWYLSSYSLFSWPCTIWLSSPSHDEINFEGQTLQDGETLISEVTCTWLQTQLADLYVRGVQIYIKRWEKCATLGETWERLITVISFISVRPWAVGQGKSVMNAPRRFDAGSGSTNNSRRFLVNVEDAW